MGRGLLNIKPQNNNNMAQVISRRRPTVFKPIVGAPVYREIWGDERKPCSTTVTDRNGITWTYTGWIDRNGVCHYYERKRDAAAFNGEREVWTDLQGYSNLEGDSCAIQNPDGSITTGKIVGGKCTAPSKGRGWDFASNLLNLANQFIGVRQDTASTQVNVPAPPPQRSGMSTGAIIGIVAGVAVIGGIIYFVAKK